MIIDPVASETVHAVSDAMYSSFTFPTEKLARAKRAGLTRKRAPGHAELLEPRVAAVEMIEEFQTLATALCPRDRSTQDDLIQEMCLGVLECSSANGRSYYLWLANWRAKDYLRWWQLPMKRAEPREPAPDVC